MARLSELTGREVVRFFWLSNLRCEAKSKRARTFGEGVPFVLAGFVMPIFVEGFSQFLVAHTVVALVNPADRKLPVFSQPGCAGLPSR